MSKYCVVLVTAPAGKNAEALAKAILSSRKAACVNVVPGVTSLYWWKGKIEKGRESLLVIKTPRRCVPDLIQKIRRVHPYEVPEILALPIVKGYIPYLNWLTQETRGR